MFECFEIKRLKFWLVKIRCFRQLAPYLFFFLLEVYNKQLRKVLEQYRPEQILTQEEQDDGSVSQMMMANDDTNLNQVRDNNDNDQQSPLPQKTNVVGCSREEKTSRGTKKKILCYYVCPFGIE